MLHWHYDNLTCWNLDIPIDGLSKHKIYFLFLPFKKCNQILTYRVIYNNNNYSNPIWCGRSYYYSVHYIIRVIKTLWKYHWVFIPNYRTRNNGYEWHHTLYLVRLWWVCCVIAPPEYLFCTSAWLEKETKSVLWSISNLLTSITVLSPDFFFPRQKLQQAMSHNLSIQYLSARKTSFCRLSLILVNFRVYAESENISKV